jgi:hypothetical protein
LTNPTPAIEPLPLEQSALLADFARACRVAARSVSLYPATHPSIQASLARVMNAADRLISGDDVQITVLPDTLAVDGRAPAKPDGAVIELAELMHDRLVGALRMQRGADVHDWHALLLLVARPAEELMAEGGIGTAWTASGRSHFAIREIDYGEVLRERAGSEAGKWDAIVAYCLDGAAGPLDEAAVTTFLEMLGDAKRFSEFLEQLQAAGTDRGDLTIGAKAAALLRLIEQLLQATAHMPRAQGEDAVLQTTADAMSRVTPEMLLAVMRQTMSPEPAQAQVATAVLNRIKDATVASFVATSVVNERGASERLAQAFEALVPDLDRKERLLDLAKEEVADSPLGQQPGFEDLWQSARQMLTSYSDKHYVSEDYARELSGARTQAIDVERVSDDPPERIQTWLATVVAERVKELDLRLLLDLLQVEHQPAPWGEIARFASGEIERCLQAGRLAEAQTLAEAVVRDAGPNGREPLRAASDTAIESLVSGPFVRHLVSRSRTADDADVEALAQLCRTIGPRVIRPLAQALVTEQNARAIRHVRDLLFGFGSGGREVIEQLKLSSNPAVRRTAIDLLRMFGGAEALAELTSMLKDRDQQVQREAIRALVRIGSDDAFALLRRALQENATRMTVLQEIIGHRDERVVPLLCAVLNESAPRGPFVEVHAQVIDALGALGDHQDSAAALRAALYRGEWWAPYRTATLRDAAAAALRRIGSPATMSILEEAARNGSRGVRKAARPHLRLPSQRARQQV